jgi:hypothetical protein
MKNKPKPRTRLVQLDPYVIEMIDYACKAEGITREQVLLGLLEHLKAEQTTG